jgi:2-oxoglutarate dehydrogenase E2 component (dihydrolipoamide succinyltransferase)
MEILLPKMGESVAEATIIKCLVEPGASVEADESLIDIATDMVDSGVPAPEAGVLVRWLVAEGDVVQVGQPICEFQLAGESSPSASKSPASEEAAPAAAAPPVSPPAPEVMTAVAAPLSSTNGSAPAPARTSSDRFYSPLVRSMAQAENIAQSELDSIAGTGLEGRVTKHDMQGYITARSTSTNAPAAQGTPNRQPAHAPAVVSTGEDQIIEMDRMRKLIADHMVRSVQTSPHVTSFVEADVTRIVNWRNKNKVEFAQRTGQKLTFTPFFIEAVARALRDFPGVNASVDGDKIIQKGSINVGMATATPQGNLIVPVIRNADQFNLAGLAEKVNELAQKARSGKLSPDDISGGTYTVSNVGTFGNVMGTPIINQPQVAILALGAIRKQPAVVETPEGDVIAIRHRMFLSHSYDHRVVDGQMGGSFVRCVADYLEAFDLGRPVS